MTRLLSSTISTTLHNSPISNLIRSYKLSKLAARLLHLQANTPEITGRVGSNNQNKVTYLSKLDWPSMHFNNHVMHFDILYIFFEILNRAKNGFRHSSPHFLICPIPR